MAENVHSLRIAKLMEGFSGSDLREFCRNAAVYRVRDYIETQDEETFQDAEEEESFRAITMDDMLKALAKMTESRVDCGYIAPVDLD